MRSSTTGESRGARSTSGDEISELVTGDAQGTTTALSDADGTIRHPRQSHITFQPSRAVSSSASGRTSSVPYDATSSKAVTVRTESSLSRPRGVLSFDLRFILHSALCLHGMVYGLGYS